MKYKQKDGLITEEVNGKLVVLDPEQGKYFNLNRTAAEVWLSLKKPQTEEHLLNILCKRYSEKKREIVAQELKEYLFLLGNLKIVFKFSR